MWSRPVPHCELQEGPQQHPPRPSSYLLVCAFLPITSGDPSHALGQRFKHIQVSSSHFCINNRNKRKTPSSLPPLVTTLTSSSVHVLEGRISKVALTTSSLSYSSAPHSRLCAALQRHTSHQHLPDAHSSFSRKAFFPWRLSSYTVLVCLLSGYSTYMSVFLSLFQTLFNSTHSSVPRIKSLSTALGIPQSQIKNCHSSNSFC